MNDQDPNVPPTPAAATEDETATAELGARVPPMPPGQDGSPAAAAAPWWGDRKRLAGAVAGVAVVAAVGVGGGYALGHAGNGSDTRVAGRFGGPFPGGVQGGPSSIEGMPGQHMQGQDMPGPMGGVDGEQHVTGTLAKVGDGTVTVETTSGTQTYQVTDATQILQDGSSATLAELKTGQSVLVHVLPGGSGDGTAERVLVGSSATNGGFGQPPTDQAPQTS